MKKLSILILASHVPFSRGGAELLIDKLKAALIELGHEVDVLSLPFSAEPKSQLISQMALWRSLSLDHVAGRTVDIVIATKFPTYFVQHPCKVVWLIHQHRQAYELVGTRYGDFSESDEDEAIRGAILKGDLKALAEAKSLYTISENVSKRLDSFLSLKSTPLLPPLPWKREFQEGIKGDYILSVGRLCSSKRTDLIIQALPSIAEGMRLKIVGLPDEPHYEEYLKSEIAKHHLSHRVEFLGSVSEEELMNLYANCFAVYYGPYDEDYGFVTYEAAASRKPIVSTNDSGYVCSVIKSSNSGVIVNPNPASIAEGFQKLMEDTSFYDGIVKNTFSLEMPGSWVDVARELISSRNAD